MRRNSITNQKGRPKPPLVARNDLPADPRIRVSIRCMFGLQGNGYYRKPFRFSLASNPSLSAGCPANTPSALLPLPKHPLTVPATASASDAGGIGLPDLARVPTRNTNSRSYSRCWNVHEQWLDLLREHFTRKPSWLPRCVPFRARLRVPSPHVHWLRVPPAMNVPLSASEEQREWVLGDAAP
jgi:hypothetical protein